MGRVGKEGADQWGNIGSREIDLCSRIHWI